MIEQPSYSLTAKVRTLLRYIPDNISQRKKIIMIVQFLIAPQIV